MKVSKTISIDLDLLSRTLEANPKFSEIVTLALENFLILQKQSKEGNMIHFSRSFNFNLPPEKIWELMTFDSMVEYHPMLQKAEYITKHKNGLGAKCKLYSRLGKIEATSIAEIVEYEEYSKLAYLTKGDFNLYSYAILNPKGKKTEIILIITIELNPALASDELRKEIYTGLTEFFEVFNNSVFVVT